MLEHTNVATDGWTNGRTKGRTLLPTNNLQPIPYYYNGYNDSTVANVYTHYNAATCYTPSTKST